MTETRRILVTVAGHVDHGKSSILDNIRGTTVAEREAGKITQAIGASIIPIETIKRVCGELLGDKTKLTIPGILAIDTPGHAAFTNLRKRGGNLADIAVVVIDIREGIMPQTLEVIEILKQYKTPFIIAANKIDLIQGWQSKSKLIIQNISEQNPDVTGRVEAKMYELVGKLSELGFNAERFDRVEDYTKQIAIVPTSAKTGEGIPELLMVLTGLAQKFLEKCLECDVGRCAKGTILEVKEEKGIGKCVDVIIYDGHIKKNDTLVIGGMNGAIVTKAKALFEPAPLAEMRDKKSKFKAVPEVFAAIGVKIAATDIQDVVAGMPVRTCLGDDIEKIKEEVQKEVEEVVIETEQKGIVIKADTLGSLEALIKLLQDKNIPIKRANIGNISKKDINDAAANHDENPLHCVVLGFNVIDDSGICNDRVKLFTNQVIYKLIEDFEKWQEAEKKRIEAAQLDQLTRPYKLEVLKGYVFRQNNPAVFGVEVLEGSLLSNTRFMKNEGKPLGSVKSIQLDKENVEKAEKGKQVAISVPGITIGRQVNEGDILLSAIPEEDFRKIKTLKQYLSKPEITLLKEIAEIKRKENPVWGI